MGIEVQTNTRECEEVASLLGRQAEDTGYSGESRGGYRKA
jgi:hypothetical protein